MWAIPVSPREKREEERRRAAFGPTDPKPSRPFCPLLPELAGEAAGRAGPLCKPSRHSVGPSRPAQFSLETQQPLCLFHFPFLNLTRGPHL